MGRKPIKAEPMTAAERQTRRRKKVRDEQHQFSTIFELTKIAQKQAQTASNEIHHGNKDEAKEAIKSALGNMDEILKIIRDKTSFGEFLMSFPVGPDDLPARNKSPARKIDW